MDENEEKNTENEEKNAENSENSETLELSDIFELLSDVKNAISAMHEAVASLKSDFTDAISTAVENGAVINDNDDDVHDDIVKHAAEELENLDYTL